MKTRAAQILDKLGIEYEIKEFDHEAVGTEEVVKHLGIPHEQVFKTLVTRGDRTGVILALVPGHKELNLKALAKVSGNKRCEMIPKKDVQKTTGFIPGGCTALGGKREFPVYMDSSALGLPFISVSAGMRGIQLFVAPGDWARAVKAKIVDIAR